MTTTTPGVRQLGADTRFRRLAEQVRSVRGHARFGRPDTWMLAVGGALMPLGLAVILLGWRGASHTPLVFEQTPYLISGGLLGLALVLVGGFVYFGYWQTVRIRESRQQASDLAAAVARLELLLAPSAVDSDGQRTGVVVATPRGSIYHRPDCVAVAGRRDLRRVDPEQDGLTPCQICEPLADDR